MNIWQIIGVLLSSGLAGALAGGFVNHFSNKKLDVYKRIMETRKDSYTKVNEILSSFYSTATDAEKEAGKLGLLKLYREVQIWGSDEVVRSFSIFLTALSSESASQEKRNICHKRFVVAMRNDLLGKTDIIPEELDVIGEIK